MDNILELQNNNNNVDIYEKFNLTEDDRHLLLASVNCYIEKLEFNIKNADTYFLGSFGKSFFEDDLSRLKKLRSKIFTTNVIDYEVEIEE